MTSINLPYLGGLELDPWVNTREGVELALIVGVNIETCGTQLW